MTDHTEALIGQLVRGLRPVRRLPALGRVAAYVVAVSLGLAAVHVVFACFTKTSFPKSSFAAVDAWTLVAHALLAVGALAFALGACVPGRERLARSGALAIAVAFAGVAWIGCVRFAAWPGAVAPGWFLATLACSLGTIVPAVLPAAVLAHFAAHAAPRRAPLVLLVGAAASLALLTAPGIVGCDYPDELHHTVAHLLTPALGVLILLLVSLPVYLRSRLPREA